MHEVHVLHIAAEVGSLIGADSLKAAVPWQTINSRGSSTLYSEEPLQLTKKWWGTQSVAFKYPMWKTFWLNCAIQTPQREDTIMRLRQFLDLVKQSTQLVNGDHATTERQRHKNAISSWTARYKLQRGVLKESWLPQGVQWVYERAAKRDIPPAFPEEQLNSSDVRVWLIPHHGLYHLKKKKLNKPRGVNTMSYRLTGNCWLDSFGDCHSASSAHQEGKSKSGEWQQFMHHFSAFDVYTHVVWCRKELTKK